MTLNVAKELAAMEHMTTGELQEKYAEVFGEATRSRHKQYLIKRIIWRIQANAEGGLSERALRRQLRRDEADIQGLAVRGTMTNGGLARLADLQERVRLGEGRLVKIDQELDTLDAQYISEAEVAEKLAAFQPVWESLSPREQSRLIHLLVERVDFDGVGGNGAITFHPTGIRTFASEFTQEAVV